MLNQAVSNGAQIGIELVVIDDPDMPARHLFCHGIAEINFLLIGENILFMGDRLNGGRKGASLRRQRDGQEWNREKRECQADTKPERRYWPRKQRSVVHRFALLQVA